jgi:hypothetical protein
MLALTRTGHRDTPLPVVRGGGAGAGCLSTDPRTFTAQIGSDATSSWHRPNRSVSLESRPLSADNTATPSSTRVIRATWKDDSTNDKPALPLRAHRRGSASLRHSIVGERLGASRLPYAALRRFAVLTRPARPLDLATTGASRHQRQSEPVRLKKRSAIATVSVNGRSARDGRSGVRSTR